MMGCTTVRAKFRIPLLDPLDQIVSQNIIVEKENENLSGHATMASCSFVKKRFWCLASES
jgi:hypothetical protein